MKLKTLITTIALLSLTNCASIVSDSDYSIIVRSEQRDIDFKIKDLNNRTITKGTTPEIVRLKAGTGYFESAKYTIEYLNEKHPLDAEMDGWYWGNILFGGLIGMLIVDPITGAMYKLPEEVHLDNDLIKIKNDRNESNKRNKDRFKLN